MSTQIIKSKKSAVKNSTNKPATAKKTIAKKPVTNSVPVEGEQNNIAVGEIDFSPLNYRKYYSAQGLSDFAQEIALHGIISPLTLRKMPSGRYELVVGERRLKAAQMLRLKEIPAVIKILTDAEVTELQLSENIQRENPHPMDEAQGIGQMQQTYQSFEAIAARLGKSKTYVYSRIKLLQLIEPLREMFYADVISIQEAYDIAALSAQSQQEFFDQFCAEWKETEDFTISNLRHALSRFKYDLKNAPFDTKDKKLVPEMGACTNCPFNSAALKTLFPETAAEAICTKRECYQTKCDTQFIRMANRTIKNEQPVAVIYDWQFTASLQKLLDTIPELDGLEQYGRNEVAMHQPPLQPDRNDYTIEPDEEDDQQDWDENEGEEIVETITAETAAGTFDEAGYNAAWQEYETDLEEFQQLTQTGNLSKGLLVSATKSSMVLFSLDTFSYSSSNGKTGVTAKEVQQAIQAGTATPELLEAEMDRIRSREARAKELDSEKIQLSIHAAFIESNSDISSIITLTEADLTAARLIVYQSLDYSARNTVNKMFSEVLSPQEGEAEWSFCDGLQKLTDQQYSYLIRMAIGGKSDGKLPHDRTGEMVRRVAQQAGTDIAAIAKLQEDKATTREDKLKLRIAELATKIKRLKSKTGLVTA